MIVLEIYEKSLKELKKYLKMNNIIPSGKVWNKYCLENELLCSKSLEYMYGEGFNRMCRNLIKEVRKEK